MLQDNTSTGYMYSRSFKWYTKAGTTDRYLTAVESKDLGTYYLDEMIQVEPGKMLFLSNKFNS